MNSKVRHSLAHYQINTARHSVQIEIWRSNKTLQTTQAFEEKRREPIESFTRQWRAMHGPGALQEKHMCHGK